jgi:HAD superfamily hydrolase (TIGR01509 family)
MTAAASRPADPDRGPLPSWLGDVVAITLDFGNTLVPVDRVGLSRVVDRTAEAMVERSGPFTTQAFLDAWSDERARQFREEVPRFREVDMEQRLVRVLARLRGMDPPSPDEAWDDEAAAALVDAAEVAYGLEVYSDAFVGAMPPPPAIAPLLGVLSRGHRLGVLSNWPLARTIDRYVEAAGWSPSLTAVVVSQRVGAIKPHPDIFRAAEAALGVEPRDRARILHVGDDWAADVVGARSAGWRAAYLRRRPEDSPLPSSQRDVTEEADVELDALDDLAALFAGDEPAERAGRPAR